MFGSYYCIVNYTCMASPRNFSEALSTVGCICIAEEGALPSYQVQLHFDPARTRQEFQILYLEESHGERLCVHS